MHIFMIFDAISPQPKIYNFCNFYNQSPKTETNYQNYTQNHENILMIKHINSVTFG